MLKSGMITASGSPTIANNIAEGWVPRISQWFDVDHETLYTFHGDSNGTDGVWVREDGLLYTQETIKGGDTVTGTTAATLFASQVDVPANVVGAANWLADGTELSVFAGGTYTTVGDGNAADFGISFGGAVVATAAPAIGNNKTDEIWFFQGVILGNNTVDAANEAKGIIVSGQLFCEDVCQAVYGTAAVTSTVANTIALSVTPNQTDQSWTMRQFVVTLDHPPGTPVL